MNLYNDWIKSIKKTPRNKRTMFEQELLEAHYTIMIKGSVKIILLLLTIAALIKFIFF